MSDLACGCVALEASAREVYALRVALAQSELNRTLEVEDAARALQSACGFAWDVGARQAVESVRCFWCGLALGNDPEVIRAHVAVCRQEVSRD